MAGGPPPRDDDGRRALSARPARGPDEAVAAADVFARRPGDVRGRKVVRRPGGGRAMLPAPASSKRCCPPSMGVGVVGGGGGSWRVGGREDASGHGAPDVIVGDGGCGGGTGAGIASCAIAVVTEGLFPVGVGGTDGAVGDGSCTGGGACGDEPPPDFPLMIGLSSEASPCATATIALGVEDGTTS